MTRIQPDPNPKHCILPSLRGCTNCYSRHNCINFRHGKHSVRIRRSQRYHPPTKPQGIQPRLDEVHQGCTLLRLYGVHQTVCIVYTYGYK